MLPCRPPPNPSLCNAALPTKMVAQLSPCGSPAPVPLVGLRLFRSRLSRDTTTSSGTLMADWANIHTIQLPTYWDCPDSRITSSGHILSTKQENSAAPKTQLDPKTRTNKGSSVDPGHGKYIHQVASSFTSTPHTVLPPIAYTPATDSLRLRLLFSGAHTHSNTGCSLPTPSLSSRPTTMGGRIFAPERPTPPAYP